jgi:hypothetical protein
VVLVDLEVSAAKAAFAESVDVAVVPFPAETDVEALAELVELLAVVLPEATCPFTH